MSIKEDLLNPKLEASINLLMNYSYLKEAIETSNLRMSSFQFGEYDVDVLPVEYLDVMDRNRKIKKLG